MATDAAIALDALPVALTLGGGAAARIRRLVEGELGWQPLEDGPVSLVVADVAGGLGLRPLDIPTLLLVGTDDDPRQVAEVLRRLSPDEVLAWPPEGPEELRDAAAAALRRDGRRPTARDDAPVLTVGGASGGVGTTTVTLALAGLVAWSGRRTVAIVHGAVPHPTGPPVATDALGSPSLGAALRPARGVPGLRIVRAAGPAPPVGVTGGVTVVDRGRELAADVLVCRRDAAGLEALTLAPAGAAVVTDSGPVPWSALRRAAGSRRLVLLPWSARVARAGAAGRVPASLPGSWLAHLRPIVVGGPGRG